MARKKYIKNEKGIVRALATTNLGLEKPLTSDFYSILIFNNNMDKIDTEIKKINDLSSSNKSEIENLKGQVEGLELKAEKVTIADPTNKFEATNVEDALLENKTSILELEKTDGDLANLQTTNKDNLVNAINEVFQNANNGKDIIANAIGSPLVNSDTFSGMGTKIDALTQTFQNTLTEKGIEVLPNDKMSTLIDKVELLEDYKVPMPEFLYKEGEEYIKYTGGFNHNFFNTINKGTSEKHSNSLVFGDDDGNAHLYGGFSTNNKIDVSDLTSIEFNLKRNYYNGNQSRFGVALSNINSGIILGGVIPVEFVKYSYNNFNLSSYGRLAFDVSDIDGEYYLLFWGQDNQTVSGRVVYELNEIKPIKKVIE